MKPALQQAPQATQATQRNFIANKDRLSVLVADDDPFVCRLITAILQDSGIYNVHTVKDGQEAFNHLKERTFDLAILDIHMPDVNGIALSAQIRALDRLQRRRTGIIIMTTQCDARLLPFVKANEVDQLCLKPLARTTFIQRIAAALTSRNQAQRGVVPDDDLDAVWI